MKRKVLIKNMVCDRCKTILEQELQLAHIRLESIQLGEIIIDVSENFDNKLIENLLNKNGFELVKEASEMLTEKIKIAILFALENNGGKSLSSYLVKSMNKNYSILSKSFSKNEGITIEKYFINLKIEKAKEHIQMDTLNFSQIAYELDYKSSSYLARQFKTVSGMSMSTYKKLQKWDRRTLDQIV